MKLTERVRLTEAAKLLGVCPQSVREHMRRKLWDLGDVQSPAKTGKSRYEFFVYRHKLNKHLGIEGGNPHA